jgi:MFS family permease
MLRLSNSWFRPRYYAMLSGLIVFCGIIGAVVAGPPLRFLMNQYSWRGIMLVVAAATLAIGIAIRLFVRDFPHEKGFSDPVPSATGAQPPRLSIGIGIKEILRHRNTLILLLTPGSLAGGNLTFAGLWGVPYMTTHYGLARSHAAVLATTLLVALALGGPVMGWLSDRWGRRKPFFIIGFTLSLTGWTAVFFVPDLPHWVLAATLVMIGFSSGCMVLSYAFGKESVPAHLAGTISGVINMGIMTGPMLLQPVIGWVLDRYWDGLLQNGVRVYGINAYQAGFRIVLGWLALALVMLLFTRETHCRQRQYYTDPQ